MRPASHTLIRLAILAICLVVPAVSRAADGGIYFYLQPLPSEASRLSFTIGSISAITGTGSTSALNLNLPAVGSAQAFRQRLLASGRLPVGSYSGVTLTIKQAFLNNDHGRAALALPDTPVPLNVPFVIGAEPTVIWLTLRYQSSVTANASFSPVFTADTPPRPIADHAGFVSNAGSNTLTVFDKNLAQAVAVIDSCAGPAGMALDQLRRRLYVACPKEDEVRSIDVTTGQSLERARLSPGDRPRELALTPDGTTLISVNTGSNSISFYDAASLVRRERINVGSGPASIVIEPAGRRAFVLNMQSSSLSVIDVVNRTVLATLSMESAPIRARFSARSDRLYVIHERSPYMTVLDPRQLTAVGRARLRIGVSAIAVDTVRDLVCIGGENDTSVDFYDPNALMPLYSVRTKSGVSYLAFDAEDNILYSVSTEARTVSAVRLANRRLASEIDVGDAPYAVTVMGEK